MRKLLMVLSSVLAAVLVGFFSTAVAKADDHPHEESTNHCVCGGNSEGVSNPKNPDIFHKTCSTATWTGVSTAEQLAAEFAKKANVNIYLKNDITLEATLKPVQGYKYSVCLNGYTLTAPVNGRAFSTAGGNSKTYIRLSDCSEGKTGKVQANEETTAVTDPGGLVGVNSGGQFWMFGGTLTGGRTSSASGGGNVCVGNGTFYLYGGTISDGKVLTSDATKARGGNVSVYGTGTGAIYRFYMFGGTITNEDTLTETETGNAYDGGNIYVNIPANTTYEPHFEIHGGSIVGGTAAHAGGNIYVTGNITLVMDGGTVSDGLINNTGGGGNIYCASPFQMTGGTVSGGRILKSLNGGNGANVSLPKGSIGSFIKDEAVIGAVGSNSRSGAYCMAVTDSCEIGTGAKIGAAGQSNTIQLNGGSSDVTINGGLIYGWVAGVGGTLEINGGIITGTLRSAVYGSTACQMTVNGGFVKRAERYSSDAAMTLNGGYFGEIAATNPVTIGDGRKSVEFNHSESYDDTALVTAIAVIPETAPIGKRLALNESLSVYFEGEIDQTVPYLKNGTKISFAVDGGEAVTGEAETEGTLTRYAFDGITPECLKDEITADFISKGDDGKDYVLYTSTFTLKDYLDAVPSSSEYAAMSAEKKAAMDTLIRDLLVYGREAQKKFNHKTDDLVVAEDFTGSGRTPAGGATGMDPVINASNAGTVDGYFKLATVIHENTNWVRVQYKDNASDGATTFTLNDAEPELVENNFVCTAGMMPTEYDKVLVFKALRNGTPVATLTYSVNTYCVNRHVKNDVFADALFNYGASAKAFAAAE